MVSKRVVLADVTPERKKTRTRVRSDVPPERKKTGTRVRSDVPPERKPERGHIRQNHPFTKLRAEKTMTATDVTGFDAIFSTGFFAIFSRF